MISEKKMLWLERWRMRLANVGLEVEFLMEFLRQGVLCKFCEEVEMIDCRKLPKLACFPNLVIDPTKDPFDNVIGIYFHEKIVGPLTQEQVNVYECERAAYQAAFARE